MNIVKAILPGKGVLLDIKADVREGTVELDGNIQPVSDIAWNPPVCGTVYGAALNFQGRWKEMEDAFHQAPYKQPPKAPVLYIKPLNTLTGANSGIPLPTGEEKLEMGASLAVVIGKTATRVKAEDAFDYIEGYTIANDVSIPHASVYRPAIKQKARDGFCPIGPWIVSKDDVANPDQLDIRVYVNGELKQENNTRNFIRSVSKLMEDVTDFMTLRPGDVLLAGVPEGAPLAGKGDRVRIEISGIGALENTIVPEERGEAE